MLAPPSEQALNELLARKEEEWRALQARRSRLQEAALRDAHSRLEEAQGALRRLQEDFVYNLQVLEERDRELERYDAVLAQARRLEEARQAQVSELKSEVAKLRRALATEAGRLEDLQREHQLKLQEHRLQLERVHSDKNGEIDQQHEQYEKLKWKLERKLQELDGELALQRQELLLEFESEMQRREHGFRLHADSMSNEVLTHELKVKLLNEELAAVRAAGAGAAASLQRVQAAHAELEDRLQRATWELQGLAAVRDARIKDLEDKLQCVQLSRNKEEETFRRKHAELDRVARERDAALAAAKDAHAEQLRALEAQVLELRAQCEERELQARRAEWRQADTLQERDAAVDKLREEASALRSGWDAQVAQLSKELTAKDLEIQALREGEAQHKAQLARCQQDIGRYRRQLSLAVGRERSLERDKVQLGLDWQRRCDDIERDHYRKSEELIGGLTTAREQVTAKLQEAERKLLEQEAGLKAVTLERDQAVQALRTGGLPPEREALPGHHEKAARADFPSGEIRRLQEQNASLRSAVAQMRAEMEALSGQVPPCARPGAGAAGTQQPGAEAAADADTDAAAPAPGHVLALEAEIRTLKCGLKTLEERLRDTPGPPSHGDTQPGVHPPAGAAGGAAPAGSSSVGLALRQLGDRAHLVSFLVARLRHKVLRQPLQLDTVRRELPCGVGQLHLEALELQKQLAELEKHLGTAQEEDGAPPSGQPARASDAGALGRQGPAARGPAGTEAPSVQRLQRKLKEAARAVLRLRLEKEQLLELGNRLRAELGRPAGKPQHPLLIPEKQDRGDGPGTTSERGPPLGQLQPHLTTPRDPETLMGEASTSHLQHTPQPGTEPATQRRHKISAVTSKSTRQKENRSPKPQRAHERPQDSDHRSQRSSSLASGSLRDTWKLLELGSSPSGLTSQDDCVPELTALPAAESEPHSDGSPVKVRAAFAIRGRKLEARTKAKPARPSRAHPAKPKGRPQPPKVRNYNFKD